MGTFESFKWHRFCDFFRLRGFFCIPRVLKNDVVPPSLKFSTRFMYLLRDTRFPKIHVSWSKRHKLSAESWIQHYWSPFLRFQLWATGLLNLSLVTLVEMMNPIVDVHHYISEIRENYLGGLLRKG